MNRRFPTPVVQSEPTGCGIASVAALAGVSYKAAQRSARQLGIVASDPCLWSDTRHVRRLLNHYGLRVHATETSFVSWSALPSRALLAVKWHREGQRSCWHWVVFVRKGRQSIVLDSAPALKRPVRTDFGRMKPKWFIGVGKQVSRA